MLAVRKFCVHGYVSACMPVNVMCGVRMCTHVTHGMGWMGGTMCFCFCIVQTSQEELDKTDRVYLICRQSRMHIIHVLLLCSLFHLVARLHPNSKGRAERQLGLCQHTYGGACCFAMN